MAIRDDFLPGEVLAASDLNDTFAAKVDYALPTNAQTGTTYTFVAADAEKLTTASNAAAVTLTIPPQSSVAWADNTILRVVNYGAGAVTVEGGSGVTVTNTATTLAQFESAAAIRTASNAWTIVPFSGGVSTLRAADVSGTTGSPTITSAGGFTVYRFTGSGSITFSASGLVESLVVGGGGGGGHLAAGGGGAGGIWEGICSIAPVGLAVTVTIGAGGAGGAADNRGSNGSNSRFAGSFCEGGGGGGSNANPSGNNGGSGGGSTSTAAGAGVAGIGRNGGQNEGGGGGAGAVGGTGAGVLRSGGSGVSSLLPTNSPVFRGGGGGGGSSGGTAGSGGAGGGGAGSNGSAAAVAGTVNTGGGGGGGGNPSNVNGAAGGSGVVFIRVRA